MEQKECRAGRLFAGAGRVVLELSVGAVAMAFAGLQATRGG